MELTRNEAIRYAIQLRSDIGALVAAASEPLSLAQISHQLKEKCGNSANLNQIDTALRNMYRSGELFRVRVARKGSSAKYAYEVGNGKPPQAENAGSVSKETPPSPPRQFVNLPADLRLNIIKPTGKLRIEYRGLSIELGVIE